MAMFVIGLIAILFFIEAGLGKRIMIGKRGVWLEDKNKPKDKS